MQEILSLILGGGRGTRLYPLTKYRSKPAVPLGGKYRLIDIPMSNCINSGLRRIYVLTQFLSVSLHRHITNTYKFDPFSQGFAEILAAQQTNERSDWYQGTADAVRQNLLTIESDPCTEVLILSGDQLYRMDYRKLYATHRDSEADVTIAVIPVPRDQVAGFGIVQLDDTFRVRSFVEKPKTQEQLRPVFTPDEWLTARGLAPDGRNYLANMGIYLFKRGVLFDLLENNPSAIDFGKEVFPQSLHSHKVQAHLFDGYWEDVGTVKSYHEANLALASTRPPFNFHSAEGNIYTHMRYLAASRICGATLRECLVGDGGLVGSGTVLERSVLGIRCHVGERVTLRETVLNGASHFETDEERAANRRAGLPDLGVGEGSFVERAILDTDCRVGRNVRITSKEDAPDSEGDNYAIRDGVVVIPRGAVVPDGTVI